MGKAVRTVSDFRAALGADADRYSDEELLGAMAAATGHDMPTAAEKFGYDTNNGPWHEEASSSISREKSNLYGVGEVLANRLGATSAESFFGRRRRANDIAAGISGQRAVEGGIPDDWRSIDGVGSAARYVGGLAIGTAPQMAEMAAGGLAGRGVRLLAGGARAGGLAAGSVEAANAVRASDRAAVIGGVSASYPDALADNLSGQREQIEKNGGNPNDPSQLNLGAGAAAAVPYAIINAFNPLERAAAKTSLPHIVSPVFDNIQGVKGRIARIGGAAVETAIGEGAGEVGQEMLNQLGRMSVDERETFWNEDAKKRYLDNFVGGAALGGTFGGGLSFGRRSEHYRGLTSPLDTRSGDIGPDPFAQAAGATPTPPAPTPAAQDILALPYNSLSSQTLHVFPDGTTALASDADAYRFAPQPADPAPVPRIGYDPRVGSAVNPVVNADPMVADPRGRVATNEADAFAARVAPQPAGVNLMNGAPIGQSVNQSPNVQEGATTAPAMGYEPPAPVPVAAPAQSQEAPAQQPAPPVQHSGTPEALARIEETKQRKVAATDAIARAQEAGMVSEKQQTLFWRGEELAQEHKLSESKMTQITALLMQSKFGQVKAMLDEAAAGQPDADGQAVVKQVTKDITALDKERKKLTDEQLTLLRKDGRPPYGKSPNAVRYAELEAQIESVKREQVAAVKHGAEKAGVTQPVTVAPATEQVQPAPTPAAPVPGAPQAVTPAAPAPTMSPSAERLKASAERANKIRRLESLLACLTR